jgi:negative regulator of sigma E activity
MTVTDTGGQVRKRDAKTRQRNLTRLEAKVNSERARADFAGTLNALEDKLNVPKQVRITSERAKVELRRFANEQPVAAMAVAVGVVAAVGVTVWLVVRAVTK